MTNSIQDLMRDKIKGLQTDNATLQAENERLRSRLAAAEAVIKIAEDAMCQATFNLRGRNCGDLNHAIDRTRKYLKQAADHAAKGGECDGRRQN